MPAREPKQVTRGMTDQRTLEVFYITPSVIKGYCYLCGEDQTFELSPEDAERDWYRFECRTCGSQSKRSVNLSKVLKSGKPPEQKQKHLPLLSYT